MSTDQDSIVIGFDTEFVTVDLMDADRVWVGEDEHMVRKIVSYQFAAIDPLDDSQLRLCVVIPRSYRGPRGSRTARLSFEKGLEIAIMSLGLHEHRLAVGWTDKGVSAQSAIGDDGKSHPSVWFKHSPEGTPRALPITLVAHYQHADLTTFVDRRKAINVWNQAYPGRSKTLSDRAGWDGRHICGRPLPPSERDRGRKLELELDPRPSHERPHSLERRSTSGPISLSKRCEG